MRLPPRWSLVLLLAVGCQRTGIVPPDASNRAAPEPSPPAAEIDLDAVLTRPIGAFEHDEDGLVARAPGLDVRASAALTLAVDTGGRNGSVALVTEAERPGAWAPAGAGAERTVDGMVERVELREGGLEQSWRIDRPLGRDLVVRVAVDGAAFVTRTDTGLHFRAEDGALGFRYSDGTLIDSTGRRTAVASRWTGDMIELVVPRTVLDAQTFPIVLDPTVSAEIEVDVPIDVAHSTSRLPQAVFDGTQWWVAWLDHGRPSLSVRVSRVATTGDVLDPHGIIVAEGAEVGVSSMAVAADRLLIVWADSTVGSAGLRAKRLDTTTGTVLDATPIEVIRVSPNNGFDVASDGTDFLVAVRSYETVRAVRVTGTGTVLDTTPISVLTTGSQASSLALGFANGRYVLAYRRSSYEIRALRIGTDGAIADPTPLVIATPTGDLLSYSPRMAASGTGFVLAWSERTLASGSTPAEESVWAMRFDDDGALGVGTPVRAHGPTTTTFPTDIDVASDGVRTVLTWQEGTSGTRDVRAARLSPAGALLDAVPILVAPAAEYPANPAVAASPSGTLCAWGGDVTGPSYLEARRMRDDGSFIDAAPFTIAHASNGEGQPVVAFGGGVYLVAWNDTRNQRTSLADIYAARLAPDGTVLDAMAIPIASDVAAESVDDIAFDGTHFLIVFTRIDPSDGTKDVYARRISADGSLPDAAPFPLVSAPGNQERASVAFDGTTHLLGWMDGRTTPFEVWAGRFAPDGTAVGSPTVIHDTNRNYDVEVGFAGGVYLVGYRYRALAATTDSHAAVRMRPDGTIVDTTPIALPGRESLVLLAGSAGFIALGSVNITGTTGSVFAKSVPASGTPGATQTLRSISGTLRSAAGAYDGSNWYAVVTEVSTTIPFHVIGITMDASGTPLPGGEFEVTAATSSFRASMASARLGRSLLAYSRLVAEAPYGRDRVRARIIGDRLGAAIGATCAGPAECASGFCVDGVCCDESCGASDPTDCHACSVSAGATMDGTCTALAAGVVCRAAVGDCDLDETCDGTSRACPPDARAGSDRICRPAVSVCDMEERCDGSLSTCPPDEHVPDGTLCSDALTCNGDEACSAGTCAVGSPVDCDDDDACTTDACAEPGGCSHTEIAGCCRVDLDCDDADVCTADRCDAHACVHEAVTGCCRSDLDCDDADVCTRDTCDVASGACVHEEASGCCRADSECDDGNACTDDRCDASGACIHDTRASCCRADSECDDGDACTMDRCMAGEACMHERIAGCGEDAGAPPPPPPPSGCGCRAPSRSGSTLVAPLILLALVALRRSRRR